MFHWVIVCLLDRLINTCLFVLSVWLIDCCVLMIDWLIDWLILFTRRYVLVYSIDSSKSFEIVRTIYEKVKYQRKPGAYKEFFREGFNVQREDLGFCSFITHLKANQLISRNTKHSPFVIFKIFRYFMITELSCFRF